jgi:hypothetical protein
MMEKASCRWVLLPQLQLLPQPASQPRNQLVDRPASRPHSPRRSPLANQHVSQLDSPHGSPLDNRLGSRRDSPHGNHHDRRRSSKAPVPASNPRLSPRRSQRGNPCRILHRLRLLCPPSARRDSLLEFRVDAQRPFQRRGRHLLRWWHSMACGQWAFFLCP